MNAKSFKVEELTKTAMWGIKMAVAKNLVAVESFGGHKNLTAVGYAKYVGAKAGEMEALSEEEVNQLSRGVL